MEYMIKQVMGKIPLLRCHEIINGDFQKHFKNYNEVTSVLKVRERIEIKEISHDPLVILSIFRCLHTD